MIRPVIIAMLLLCLSCHEKHAALSETTADVVAQAELKRPQDLIEKHARKMIKKVDYRFEVADVNKASTEITESLQAFSGYVSHSRMTNKGYEIENHMTIRVSNEYFEDLLREVDKHALKIVHRNIETEDVSKEFVDLEARLRTKREVEARYIEILRTRTGKIEEVLAAERQIGDIHEEIEATIARMNFLKDQVSYSTLDLSFYQKVHVDAGIVETPFLDEISAAFRGGLSGLVDVVVALTYAWPLLLISITAVIWFRKRIQPTRVQP